ncbi:MAG: YvcK family protein [Clostridium sp.]|nr:YvcK family protein [Clostridium sp.]
MEERELRPGETLPTVQQWENGPKIVAIGGGTGLSTMLRGLKKYTKNLTAVVTVADDGGGSGVLRREIGMLPPGDIRHCMEALANTEPIMGRLLTYRFKDGSLSGQCLGNLLLAALNGITGSFEEAVSQMGHVLAITGRVLPVTSADVQLEAVFENGARVVGESSIFSFKKEQDCRIHHVGLIPQRPQPMPAALEAIWDADLILLGPGSLYTSVIPNLLVDKVAETIAEAAAPKIYVCNIMTQDGETEGYTASDHIEALLAHGVPGMLDVCLANSAAVRPGVVERYREEDAAPLVVDRERIEAMGLQLVERDVAAQGGDYARHDPDRLAQAILELYRQKAMRIFRGTRRYIIEE